MKYAVKTGRGELFYSYKDNDAEQTIVYLHDSLGCTKLWRNFPQEIEKIKPLNILVYDRFGYGQSDKDHQLRARLDTYLHDEAEILIELLEDLNIASPILFGHSDGGSIALIAAANYPDKITAIIVEGAHVFVEKETLEGIRHIKNSLANSALQTKLIKYHGDKVDDVLFAWIETWNRPSFKNWNITNLLPKIKCPILAFQGIEDEFGTEAQLDAIKNLVSGPVETKLIHNAKHTPHKEAFSDTFTLVEHFLLSLV